MNGATMIIVTKETMNTERLKAWIGEAKGRDPKERVLQRQELRLLSV
jgi:hypothetical protein